MSYTDKDWNIVPLDADADGTDPIAVVQAEEKWMALRVAEFGLDGQISRTPEVWAEEQGRSLDGIFPEEARPRVTPEERHMLLLDGQKFKATRRTKEEAQDDPYRI
jgi:hypothetical protein